eukprot:TRINITY_DN6265_c1_g1_i1.p1 TRINITY_DN6265_c1_g1~~TRINITY_DN6265_c1_g1_i1.p1  ORF type:complete len:3472 (+),score=884.51 TRINITY_DN6265_c1_g1_i1:159-10574(+)
MNAPKAPCATSNAAAAARLLGAPPPGRPTAPLVKTAPAAAAAQLLGAAPGSSPALPASAASGAVPPAKLASTVPSAVAKNDDKVLGSLISKAAAPLPPPATVVHQAAPAPAPAPPAPGPPPPPAPPPAPASAAAQADRDASVVGSLFAAAVVPPPTVRSSAPPPLQSAAPKVSEPSDAGVLDSFLRKHGTAGRLENEQEQGARRKPPPIAISDSLDSTPRGPLGQQVAGHDDAVLRQLIGKGSGRGDAGPSSQARRDDPAAGPLLRASSASAPAGHRSSCVAPGSRPGALGGYPSAVAKSLDAGITRSAGAYGIPLTRRAGQPLGRPRGLSGGGRGAGPRRSHPAPAGRGGRAKVQRDVIEERAKDDLHEENLQLKRAQTEMKCRINMLEAKMRSAKEDPWESQTAEQKASDLEQLQRALSLGGPFSAARAQQASTSPGARRGTRGGRQQSQRRAGGGGRLRSRMTALPWGQAPPAAPEPWQQGASSGYLHRPVSPLQLQRSLSPSRGALNILGPEAGSPMRLASSMDTSGRFLEPPAFGDGRPYPASPTGAQAKKRASPRPSPKSSPVNSPKGSMQPPPLQPPLSRPDEQQKAQVPARLLPAHTCASASLPPSPPVLAQEQGLSEVELHIFNQNKHKVEEIREHNRELSKQLDELLMNRISQDHVIHRYKEKAKVKDAQIRAVESALKAQQDKVQRTEAQLQAEAHELYTKVAVLKTELHYAQAEMFARSPQDESAKRERLAQLQTDADFLRSAIRELTKRAFCSAEDQRMISEQRMKELEDLVQKKTEECEKMAVDRQKVDEEREQVVRDLNDLEQQSMNYMEDNERKAIQLDERAKAVRRAQAQLAGILENLSEEDRKVMVFSLQFLREREEKAAAEVAARVAAEKSAALGSSLPAAPAPPPAPGQGRTVAELTRRVDGLRAEKDELASELRALQDICQRERDITKDLRKMHQLDLDELSSTIQVTMADTERCKKMAQEREARVKELQLQLVKKKEGSIKQPAAIRAGAITGAPDVVSAGGFSGLSDVEGGKNVLDLYVTVGRIEERAMLEVPQRQGSATAAAPAEGDLVTLVLAEFLHCDVGCSETAAGLRPRYDSLLSFGPFEVGDAEVEHFARGAVRLELQAFASSGTSAYVLGRANLPLAALLDCTPQDPNPVVAGTLSFASEADTRIQIATIRYKAHWRTSIMQKLQEYTQRRGMSPTAVVAAAAAAAPDAGAGAKAAAGLMDAPKGLMVHIFNVTGLVPPRPGIPPELLQPYVTYEVPGHKTHFTKTGNGANVSFEDANRLVVRVDADFCRWAEGSGGLHFLVFDAAVPTAGETEEQIGLIGEVRVPLSQLLSSPFARVRSVFPLRRGGPAGSASELPPVGQLEVAINWQDEASTILAPGVGGPSIVEAEYTGGLLSEEQYQVCWQRVMRRLHVLKVAPVDWFYQQDVDKDGFWSKQEALAALSSMPIGLSVLEMEHVFYRMDVRRRGMVTLDDLAAAFQEGKKAAPLEQWARDAYRRVAEALKRQGWTAEQAFDAVARHRKAQKREFFALITSLDLGLRSEQLEWLWKLTDTNSDGLLDFSEFKGRLLEVATGTSTTSFTVPRPEEDVTAPPDTTVCSADVAAAMSEAWNDICLARILTACQDIGYKTTDKAMQQLPTREDGLVARAELLAFCQRCRARLSDWELDKVFARLDGELRGAVPPRILRTALMRCEVLDAPAQASLRRAAECMGVMHQGLLRFKPSTTVTALRSIFSEVATSKEPLIVQREELASVALRLGAEQVWMEELWFAAPKLRDNSLDIEAFSKQVEAAPMPGEGSVDAMSDEHANILMGRLSKALSRFGGAEKAFHLYRTGTDGCLSRGELEGVIAEVTKDLFSAHERMLVVRRIDANSDGRISLKELENAVASSKISAVAMGNWAEDVCARISLALRREGRTVDDLFEALAGGKGKPEVHWPDFRALLSTLEPSLTEGQLKRLWQLFDKNGDGGVSREEFHQALTPKMPAAAAPDAAEGVAPLPVLASRVGRALGQGRLPPVQALAAYGGGSAGLDLDAWLDACRGLEIPLSRAEATAFHAGLARGPGGGLVTAEAIDAAASRAGAQGVPEERWLREFILGRTQLAADAQASSPADAVQATAGGLEAVDEEVVRVALGRHCAVPDETWAKLRLLLDRRLDDGLVLWRPFLQWACGLGGGGPAPGFVTDEVCSRVAAALRRKKTSVDELFNALAGVKAAVHFQDFSAFFAQMDQSLTPQQLEQLWQSFDKNGDGSVSREEFAQRLAQVDSAAKAVTAAVCARVNNALRKKGETVDKLFDALAGVKATVQWPDFRSLFSSLEPTLRDEQLLHLWRVFDTDGDGGVSRDEFRKALSAAGITAAETVVQPGPKAAAASPAKVPGVTEEICSRVIAALRKEGKTQDQLFDALAGGKPDVRWPDFRALFAQLDPSLKEAQLEELWRDFDKNGDNGVSREEFKRTLGAVGDIARDVAEGVCARVLAALSREGKSVVELFTVLAGGRSAVQSIDFIAFFSQLDPDLSNQKLEFLWRTFDTDGDGGVSLEEFQRGLQPKASATAAAVKATPPRPSPQIAQEAVCLKVASSLRKAGNTWEQLFETLAGGKATVAFTDFADFFRLVEPSLAVSDLQDLWSSFDKDGDGFLTKAEFLTALAPAMEKAAQPDRTQPPLPPAAPAATENQGTAGLADALWAAIAEVASLRAPGAPRGSDALQQAVSQQLSAFDASREGFLGRGAFGEALRSYSPGLPDVATDALWKQVSGEGDKVAIDALVMRLLTQPASAQLKRPAVSASTTPDPEAGGPLWSALRRIRPALHENKLRLKAAFDRWLPQGASRLLQPSLAKGVADLVGGPLPEAQLQALFGAMAKNPDLGATMEDFISSFGGCNGKGFEAFGHELLGRTGRAMLRRFKGSLTSSFSTLDIAGDGEVGIGGFRAAVTQFGDLNLTNDQVNELWELARTIGGHSGDAIDFASFKIIFGSSEDAAGSVQSPVPAPLAAPTVRLEPGPSLEESCMHLERLHRLESLKHALTSRNPDGLLPFADLAAAVREAAPELSDGEVAQVCRLAPQRGGPLHAQDSYSYGQLLERFEAESKDYHPLTSSERPQAADVCRYVDQRMQAWGFDSPSSALGAAEVMPMHELLGKLQRFLPQPHREEDQRVAELYLLRLGRPLSGGCIDVAEFSQRLERLARGGLAVTVASTPADPSQAGAGVALREKLCPVEVNTLGVSRMSEVASRLQSEFPAGTAPFDRLISTLQGELKPPPTARQQDALKKWLDPAPGGHVRWPILLAFQVTVEKLSLTASKELRKLYQQFELSVAFCGRELKFKRMPWRTGLMCLSMPNTMEMQPKWHVLFDLDGPFALSRTDLQRALSQDPPPSHRLRLAIRGFSASGGSGDASMRELGCCELQASYDLPASDLRPGAGNAERVIECSAHQAGVSSSTTGPALRLTLQLSTRRAGRLWELAGGGVSLGS